jgi:hypothetical protein
VPEDYTGWFIQLPDTVDTELGGLFFESLNRTGDCFSARIVRQQPSARDLWHTAGQIAGSFQHVEVRCGNVQMTATTWREYLSSLRVTGGA